MAGRVPRPRPCGAYAGRHTPRQAQREGGGTDGDGAQRPRWKGWSGGGGGGEGTTADGCGGEGWQLQGLPAERAVVGRVAVAKELASETTARAGAARVAARTATEAAATVAVATAVGTRTARTATTTAREAAANGTPVMALGRVAVAVAEAVTVAAAKVAAERAVTVREVQLGLVGESWILEPSKNERDGGLPCPNVEAGGSHGVRRAPASSRGGLAARQGRQGRGSPRIPGAGERAVQVPGKLSSLLTVKTLTGMTTDVYPRENCIAPAMVFIVWTGGRPEVLLAISRLVPFLHPQVDADSPR